MFEKFRLKYVLSTQNLNLNKEFEISQLNKKYNIFSKLMFNENLSILYVAIYLDTCTLSNYASTYINIYELCQKQQYQYYFICSIIFVWRVSDISQLIILNALTSLDHPYYLSRAFIGLSSMKNIDGLIKQMILLDSTMFIVNKQKVISAEQLGQEALNLDHWIDEIDDKILTFAADSCSIFGRGLFGWNDEYCPPLADCIYYRSRWMIDCCRCHIVIPFKKSDMNKEKIIIIDQRKKKECYTNLA
ncbi:hypothetical protein H8356DRAFT_1332140 [Neocallimastix lanati (nom. inval.)]|nr:hypothetical protein H8356DRAFT_1332140 [Neocallimastix sp. JGI-2020a]